MSYIQESFEFPKVDNQLSKSTSSYDQKNAFQFLRSRYLLDKFRTTGSSSILTSRIFSVFSSSDGFSVLNKFSSSEDKKLFLI